MADRDSHDDWREANYWHKFTDVPCRYGTDDKTVATCISKFNNMTRFGGFPLPVVYGQNRVDVVAVDLADPDWSDHENSDPFADVAAGIAVYRRLNDGASPRLVISPRLRDALLAHPLVLERLHLSEPGTKITPALLAQLFDVADVVVV